jgi:hypothetical protein
MSKGAIQAPSRRSARIFARGSVLERTQSSSARVQNRDHSRPPPIGRAWCGRAAPPGPRRCRQPGCTPRGSGRDCEKMEAFYLPSYSPELNPDEFLNANLKHSVTTAAPARTAKALTRTAVGSLRSIREQPTRIQNYFQHKDVCYAA